MYCRVRQQPILYKAPEDKDMNDTERNHWVFRAHVLDRAGALTSIASAFSNEGVSIDTSWPWL